MTLVVATTPLLSLNAQSATTAVPNVLDNGAVKLNHTAFIIAGAGVSAGAVTLQVSNDNVNWTLTAANFVPTLTGASVALAAPGVYGVTFSYPAQYVRASITTTITGGTVTVYVASA
jgi:hypothetical protein